MGMIYANGNLITADTLDSVTSEDTVYVKEYIYNKRPSLPFRFTAKTGNQIKVDLGSAINVTFVGVIDHNLLSPTQFKIKAAAADPPAGGDWDNPDYEASLSLCSGLVNSYLKIDQTYRYWVLDIDDATNPNNVSIGEFILTTWSEFSNFHQTGDSEVKAVYAGNAETEYGQPWDSYHSEFMKFNLSVIKETTRGTIDAIRTFLETIEGSAGRFVYIPDDTYCHSYYVKAEGIDFSAESIYHCENALLNWGLTLREFPRGINFL